MFPLSDGRDYSFSKVPYMEREEEVTGLLEVYEYGAHN